MLLRNFTQGRGISQSPQEYPASAVLVSLHHPVAPSHHFRPAKGNDTERRARENILNIANDELNLSRGSILLARGRDTAPQFLDSIEEAEAQGLITEDQADHVLLADIIIRARRGEDRQYVHGVFEVSSTIRRNDIQRARDRADAVAAATKEETIAAVIGGTIQPPQRAQAEEMDVQVLIPAMFSPPGTGEEPAGPASP